MSRGKRKEKKSRSPFICTFVGRNMHVYLSLEQLTVLLLAGVPWTEEEHRMFLLGLQKLGKGDWRGIARNYVISRTPTQVASHAQKYFIRQTNVSRRKRRSSLFDIVADEVSTFLLHITRERITKLMCGTVG